MKSKKIKEPIMKNLYNTILLILLLGILAACGAGGTDSQDADGAQTEAGAAGEKLNVVATTGQIHDALQHIAGDTIELTGLLGPGVDPHLYVPTEGDVTTFAEADVIFYNGLHLEAQMSRVLDQMAQRGVVVLAIGDVLPEDQLLPWAANTYDPHIWNDPRLFMIAVEAMRDTLAAEDPANADLYRQNTEAYLQEIQATHEYILEQVERIPQDRRIMITAHDAFGYFARTYGFEVHGLQGISTESEAGTADVRQLAEFIVARKVPAIFVETSVSPRNIEAVQAAVKAQDFEVRIGGTLFSDALDSPPDPASTYTGMLRHNIDTLVSGLAGEMTERK
jgi:manganese/zinc/iron transport system substrate-binding protein